MKKNVLANQVVEEKTQLEYLLSYLSFLLRYKLLIMVITFIAAAGSVTFSIISLRLPPEESFYPNYYQAYSVLLVGQDSVSGMASMLSGFGIDVSSFGGNEINYGDLAIHILQSRPFLDSIIEKHNLVEKYKITETIKTKSRQAVLLNSEYNYEPRTGILTISYQDTDPEFTRDMVNSMVEALQEWFQQWEGSTSQQEISVLKNKIEEVTQEIDRLEQELQSFQTKYGVISVEQIAEAQTAMITDLQSQLIQTEIAIKNYSGFSNIQDQELIQLQAQRDSLRDLIRQIESGQGTGLRQMPSRDELPALAIEYSHLRMAYEVQTRIYQNLQEQYEIQRLTNTARSIFSVIEPAEIPDEKAGPSRGKLCIIVTGFAFFFSIAIALFIDFIKKIKNDPKKKSILKGTSV